MKSIFAGAAALALGAGVAAAQGTQGTSTASDQQGKGQYKIVGQVVSSDTGARTITVRSVSRREDGTRRYEMVRRDTNRTGNDTNTAAGTTAATGAGGDGSMTTAASESITVTATGKAIGELDDYKSGDWVELTCADATTARNARTGNAAGTHAGMHSGSSGAATTATGSSATTASAGATSSGSGNTDNAHARFASWIHSNCSVVSDIDGSRDPLASPDRR